MRQSDIIGLVLFLAAVLALNEFRCWYWTEIENDPAVAAQVCK